MTEKAQSRAARKFIAHARASRRVLPTTLPPVFFLTDPQRTPDPVSVARHLPRSWGVIYRHFGADDREQVAHALAHVCQQRDLVFLIAADPQLARTVGADGVHWPFRLVHQARRARAHFALMTASAHSPREARRLAKFPVDAVLISTAFASNSPSAGTPMGAVRLRTLARTLPLPAYALGGINAETGARLAAHMGLAGIESIVAAFSA